MKQIITRRLLLLLQSCLAALMATTVVVADELPDHAALFERSGYWPFYTSLVEQREIDGHVVAAGTRGVLIRMTSPDTVIVDFGRDGLAALPSSATDILERARRVRAGAEEKDFPNYTMQVGPRLVVRHGGKLGNYDFRRLQPCRIFLTVYTGEDEVMLAAIGKALRLAAGGIGSRGVFVLIMPLQVSGDHAFADKLAAADINAPFMYSHLAGFYAKSLQHDTRSLPLVVLNDADGKLLGTVNGSVDDFPGAVARLVSTAPVQPEGAAAP